MLSFLFYGLTCFNLSFALTCYKCDSVDQPAHCYQTANCQADEICMISQNPKLNGDLFFNLGCFTKATCQYLNIPHAVGRRILVNSPISITKCCDTEHCNKNLLCPGGICESTAMAAATTIASPTTTIIPTTVTTRGVQSGVDNNRITCDKTVCITDLKMFCPVTCYLCRVPTTTWIRLPVTPAVGR